MFWTEEKIAELQTLCGAGQSASQIAAVLGASRSAIIGKIYRCGFKLKGAYGGSRVEGGRNKTAKYWTEEEVARVRGLAANGLYAIAIADIMGVTFHQVISLCGRHGIDINKYTPEQEADRRSMEAARQKRKYVKRQERKAKTAGFGAPTVRPNSSRTAPAYRNQLPRLPDNMTKSELRAMLTQAVLNTVAA